MPLQVDRYTVFVQWVKFDNYVEEIDVDAPTTDAARKMAEEELKAHYKPGGKIVRVLLRPKGWWYL